MKLLIIGDQHLADRAPSARRDTYRQEVMDKIRFCMEYANDTGVDAVLNLGDVFHIKRSDRNSHSLVQETAQVFGMSKAPVIIIPGNHDIQYDDLNTIPSQPIGTLTLHPNISILMGPSEEFPIFGIPYVDPTPENLQLWTDRYREAGGADDYPLIGTHQAIFPKAEEPIFDYVSAENWAHSFKSKYTAYGHIHSRMKAGAFYEIGGTTFCNNGAISRGSLHEETIHRDLAVTLFDDSSDEPFTSIPIPYKPAEEVFLLETVELLKRSQTTVDTFLESLGTTELQFLTVEGILDEARKVDTLPAKAIRELEDIIMNITTEG